MSTVAIFCITYLLIDFGYTWQFSLLCTQGSDYYWLLITITDGTQGIIWSVKDQTQISYMQDKHSSYCIITLAHV